MKPPTKRQMVNALSKPLCDIPSNTPLQEWLDKASALHPSLAKALDGMYCGHEGRIHEQLPDFGHDVWITMGWNTVADKPRVEYAYLS